MTTEQAMNVINQMRRQFRGTGDDHDLLRQAIETLAKKIEEVPTLELKQD